MIIVIIGLVFLISIAVILGLFIIEYTDHISISKKEGLPYDYVIFDTFIKVYNAYFTKYKHEPGIKIKYGFSGGSPGVLMYNKNCTLINLTVDDVIFTDKCMIFYPWSWIRYRIWMKQFKPDKKGKRIKGLYKEPINYTKL